MEKNKNIVIDFNESIDVTFQKLFLDENDQRKLSPLGCLVSICLGVAIFKLILNKDKL